MTRIKQNRWSILAGVLLALMIPLAILAQRTVAIPDAYQGASGVTMKQLASTASSATAVNVQTNNGNIYGLSASTGAGTAVTYVNLFNAVTGNVTPGTTTAIATFVIDGAHTQSSHALIPLNPLGTPFGTALSFNCTTTANGATGATSACQVTAWVKH